MGLSCYFWKHSLKLFEAFRRQGKKRKIRKYRKQVTEAISNRKLNVCSQHPCSMPFSHALEYTPITTGWDQAQDKSYSLFLELTLGLSAWHLFIILAFSAMDRGKSKWTWEVVSAKLMCRQSWALLINKRSLTAWTMWNPGLCELLQRSSPEEFGGGSSHRA